ncbi:MAG: hypothetical protein ACJ741_02915 [Pyrinomonadaceae bacterium]
MVRQKLINVSKPPLLFEQTGGRGREQNAEVLRSPCGGEGREMYLTVMPSPYRCVQTVPAPAATLAVHFPEHRQVTLNGM